MTFDFPANKLEPVTIQLRQQHIERVRQIAQRYNCSPLNIYLTWVEEALGDYEWHETRVRGWSEKFTHPDTAFEKKSNEAKETPPSFGQSSEDETVGSSLYARLFPRTATKPKKPAKVAGIKSCLRCGKQITQKPSEGDPYWAKKKYCSKTCGARAHWKNPADDQKTNELKTQPVTSHIRYCQNSTCPKPEHTYPDGTGIEWAFHSELLRFCGEQCKEEFLERNGEKTADERVSTIL